MKLTVAAVLCVLALLYLHGPDQTSGLLGSRRRQVVARRRTTLLTTRRRTATRRYGSTCSQAYTCTRRFMFNNTLYSKNDAFTPVNAIDVNLCRADGTWCTYFKNCRTRYLANGKTLTTNLNDWTATHWGNVTTQPKPESVKVCDSAPGGMSQKGTAMTLVVSVTLGLVTGLCFLPR
ncbi:uncharacterized protein [Branchiostoma lanceolatum]|uniref:uncharacterized protein n=1 Tax=Branchiostoma lanceolatum TaxID=7740 RepID=UPI003455C0F0